MRSVKELEEPSLSSRLKAWWRSLVDDDRPPSDAWEESWEEAVRSTCLALAASPDLVECIDLTGQPDLPVGPTRLLRLITLVETAAAKHNMYASVRYQEETPIIRLSREPLS
jgi:hypothetical protein